MRYRVRRWSQIAGRWLWERGQKELTPIRILLTVLFVPLAWYVYTEASRDVIVVESVSVPKAYEERGFTSAVITLRIAERLQQLEQGIDTYSQRDRLLQSGDSYVPDIEVPATKLSLQTLVQFAQQALHHEPEHIRGEITWPWSDAPKGNGKESAVLWYHLYQGQHLLWAEKEAVGTRDPDQVVQQYAEGLLKRINPYLWAVYLGWNKHDRVAAKSAAESILAHNADRNARSEAYTLLGDITDEQGNREKAIEEYRKAIEVNPKLAVAYSNWGATLDEQGKREEAIEKYRKAIDLDPNSAGAYGNWGRLLDKQGKWDQAIEKYRKAIEADPTLAVVYNAWGNVLGKQGKRDQAQEKFRKAEELRREFH
jgi:tetratricopeptide (TPR) repeat protein